MDQPQQPNNSAISWEWVITSILGAVAGLGSLWARHKIKIDGMRERVKIESAPQIEEKNIAWAEKLIAQFQTESNLVRVESKAELERCNGALERERAEKEQERKEKYEYMQKMMSLAEQNRRQQEEIEELKERVKRLEELLDGKVREA